jgi:mannose-6-phosphate isomerase-like protein (cupin superfamily)
MIAKKSEMGKEIRESMRGGDGKIEITHIFKKENFKGKVRLCSNIKINPGCSIGEHQHLEEDEVYYIISGKGIVNDGENDFEVNKGDAVLTGNGESHSIKCIGNEPLEMMAMIVLY